MSRLLPPRTQQERPLRDDPAFPAIIKEILRQAEWSGMRIKLRMADLDVDLLKILGEDLEDFSDDRLVRGRWWTWNRVPSEDAPYWWNSPPDVVVSIRSAVQCADLQ